MSSAHPKVLKVFADYVKHYQSLPFPLTLSLEQAM